MGAERRLELTAILVETMVRAVAGLIGRLRRSEAGQISLEWVIMAVGAVAVVTVVVAKYHTVVSTWLSQL